MSSFIIFLCICVYLWFSSAFPENSFKRIMRKVPLRLATFQEQKTATLRTKSTAT